MEKHECTYVHGIEHGNAADTSVVHSESSLLMSSPQDQNAVVHLPQGTPSRPASQAPSCHASSALRHHMRVDTQGRHAPAHNASSLHRCSSATSCACMHGRLADNPRCNVTNMWTFM
eukprot:365325-Chlamydomonas_euryale.AAC.23